MTGLETALAAAAAKEASAPARALLSKLGKTGYDKLLSSFTKAFSGHVAATREKCSRIKNILYRDHSVSLASQYVHVEFSSARSPSRAAEELSDEQVISRVIRRDRCLISGTAGAGKTMFMKWGALEIIDTISSHGRIPLFLELRYYSASDKPTTLSEYLFVKTSSKKGRAALAQFEMGLEAGQFVIILDAVDEVNPSQRDMVIQKIRDFLQLYPECPVMISTRPDVTLESVQELSVIRTKPMTKPRIVEVLRKLDYDADVKDRLVSRINAGLYESHSGFLSNPLLTTIMLLSFDYAADIPAKLTSFYKQAFEALYQRHDAAKGTYSRGHHAGLPMDEFAHVFSTFCYNSYVDSKYEFSDGELLCYFREAVGYAEVTKNPELLIRDSTESVCLLQKEGLDNVFAHRSFQEYFAATFVAEYIGEDTQEVIESLYDGGYHSNVLNMLFELKRELIEIEWIVPRLQRWLDTVKDLDLFTGRGLADLMSRSWIDIDVNTVSGDVEAVALSEGEFGTWMSMIEDWYEGRPLMSSLYDTSPIIGGKGYYDLRDDPEVAKLQSFKTAHQDIGYVDRDDNDVEVISVSPADAEWLVKTNLPHRLRAVRAAAGAFLDVTLARHAARRSTVRRMRASGARGVGT